MRRGHLFGALCLVLLHVASAFHGMSSPAAVRLFGSGSSALVQRGKGSAGTPQTRMMGGGFGFGTKKKDTFKYTGTQRPSAWPAKLKPVPGTIMKPDYATKKNGNPDGHKHLKFPWDIHVNTEEEIAGIRQSARYAREVLDIAGAAVAVGVNTEDLDILVHEETIKRGGYPSPLNYHGFPKSVCTSINEVVCHGIPDKKAILKEGDMINVDVTVFCNGYHGDCSEMFCVGEVDEKGKELIQTTYDAWQAAINICKPGVKYSEIGGVIEDLIVPKGYSTTRNFCGHGVGTVFHTNPTIVHYKNKINNGVMAPGHTFTIEPMINEGEHNNVMWADGWTATTSDGGRTAQFEHTLLITEDGVEALTAKTESSPRYWWEEKK